MLPIVGLLILCGTVYLLIKRYETRAVLFGSGLLMAIVALQPMGALDAFASRMTSGGLIQAILSVMGFAFVMKYTRCDMHLVKALTGVLSKGGMLLIPGTTLVTFAINIALPSAAGAAAAVGATMIPLLMAAGIHPALAGAAVLAGTWGSMLSPGSAHNAFISELSGLPIMEVISIHAPATITAGIVGAFVLMIVAFVRKEHKGYEGALPGHVAGEKAIDSINPLYALMPILPVTILVLGATGAVPALKMGVPQAMLIGIVLTMLITRAKPARVSEEFFNGMGKAYGDVMGIIITATVFVSGMKAVGLVDVFLTWLTNTPSVAMFGSTLGPFILAIFTGSGDAAAFAFNEAVTPFAETFGMSIANMGTAASVAGAIGRSMSPLAGAAIVCAGIAGVNTLDLAKRTAPAMISALIVLMLMLF